VEGVDYNYVASHDIYSNGVAAYRKGHLVPAAAVEGPGAWLVVGEDVEPREGVRLSRPADSASQAAWSAYAVSLGADKTTAEGKSRAALIKEFG
jgi:hypothetical protein